MKTKLNGSGLDNMISKILHCYYPGKKFPSISVTGKNCALNCKHCEHQYLEHMIPAETPEKLLDVCLKLDKDGANGILISGGCNSNGKVPLEKFYNILKKIKKETNLLINVHTGLVDEADANALSDTNIDAVSVDVVGDTDTIREIYGLKKTKEDYFETLLHLADSSIPTIAPHICIGLHNGEIRGEFEALNNIKKINPPVLIINSRISRNIKKTKEPLTKDVTRILSIARGMFPDTHLVLGCMRSRKNIEAEFSALEIGVNGIVLPSKRTIGRALENGYSVKKVEMCCGIMNDK